MTIAAISSVPLDEEAVWAVALQQLQADDLQALGSLYAAAGLATPGQQRPPAPSAVSPRLRRTRYSRTSRH